MLMSSQEIITMTESIVTNWRPLGLIMGQRSMRNGLSVSRLISLVKEAVVNQGEQGSVITG